MDGCEGEGVSEVKQGTTLGSDETGKTLVECEHEKKYLQCSCPFSSSVGWKGHWGNGGGIVATSEYIVCTS